VTGRVKSSFVLAVALFTVIACALPSECAVETLPENRQALEPILEVLPGRVAASMAEDRLASVSLVVVLDGEVVFSRAFGFADVEKQKPATPGTIYPIGSVTKVFTATVLTRLWEQGVVGLEDPVQKYIPEYRPKSAFPGTLPTTLRQLAAHTSGLPQDAPVNFWCDFSLFVWLVTGADSEMTWYVDCESLLTSLSDIELVYSPEVHAHYSNLNFQVLGLALERASGESLPTYLGKEVLAPLGMKDTGFTLDAGQRERLASGYVCTGRGAPMLKAPSYELGCAAYSGGLFSTAEDMARLLAFQLQGRVGNADGILKAGSLRRMHTPQSVHLPGIHSTYGLGWGVSRIGDYEAIEHNGSLPGYHAHVSAVPDMQLGVVALSNSKNFTWRPNACKDLARGILLDLAEALRSVKDGLPLELREKGLVAYAGVYELPGGVAHLDVRVEEGALRVTLSEAPDFSELFEPVGSHTFCFATDPGRKPMLFFGASPEGRLDSVMFLSHTFRRREEGR
jgi:putative ATP-binding cassette transporter